MEDKVGRATELGVQKAPEVWGGWRRSFEKCFQKVTLAVSCHLGRD